MVKDVYEFVLVVVEIFCIVDDVLGFLLSNFVFEGLEIELK